ncbi:hypothetical protein O181_098947, partial [Austropuccinia psidii MF-1]|nr:hypothetical protein [Austropuccinia psidii MF-1]
KTRQRASRQESKSQTQQEDINETHKPFKKKIPGAYHKEDEAEEEIRVLITTEDKKTQEEKEVDNDDIEIISKNKNKEGLRQESQKMELKVSIAREEYPQMALVDIGSEINIIPEEIAIKASLTKFKPITMITGEEKEIHLLIAKGAVHTILGRPFLADNNVILEFSHKQGEIFSYPEQDGSRLCLPIYNPQAMGWQISPPRGMELCASSEIGKWSINQAESSKRKETEEKESQSSTREIALKAELKISPYTSKSTDNSLKPIGQIKNLEVTFESEEKTYLDFLVFENFNQIIDGENTSILSLTKEIILPLTDRNSKGKETEDKMGVEDSEAIQKIKEELKKIRRNLDIAIEGLEKWLALDLSGTTKEDKVEKQQKKFKMDLKLPEANSSIISEDYFNLIQEETGYIGDTENIY